MKQEILIDFFNDISEESDGAVIVEEDFKSRLINLGSLNMELAVISSYSKVRSSVDKTDREEGTELLNSQGQSRFYTSDWTIVLRHQRRVYLH